MGHEKDFPSLSLPYVPGLGVTSRVEKGVSEPQLSEEPFSEAVVKTQVTKPYHSVEDGDSGVNLPPKEVENNGLIFPSSRHFFCVLFGNVMWPRWCLIGCPLPNDQFWSNKLCAGGSL